MSCVASVAAGPARYGSTPFSQRFEPSVRSASRSELRRMPTGSKFAASSSTDVVVSDTSVSAPPMIPASAIPRFESAMSRSLRSSLRTVPSSVLSSSPLRARRTMTRLPVSVSKSNTCSGLPSASIT